MPQKMFVSLQFLDLRISPDKVHPYGTIDNQLEKIFKKLHRFRSATKKYFPGKFAKVFQNTILYNLSKLLFQSPVILLSLRDTRL